MYRKTNPGIKRAKVGLFEAKTSLMLMGLNGTFFPSSTVVSFQIEII
jgi:hypothetical protein